VLKSKWANNDEREVNDLETQKCPNQFCSLSWPVTKRICDCRTSLPSAKRRAKDKITMSSAYQESTVFRAKAARSILVKEEATESRYNPLTEKIETIKVRLYKEEENGQVLPFYKNETFASSVLQNGKSDESIEVYSEILPMIWENPNTEGSVARVVEQLKIFAGVKMTSMLPSLLG